jgi:hypothetical protein
MSFSIFCADNMTDATAPAASNSKKDAQIKNNTYQNRIATTKFPVKESVHILLLSYDSF